MMSTRRNSDRRSSGMEGLGLGENSIPDEPMDRPAAHEVDRTPEEGLQLLGKVDDRPPGRVALFELVEQVDVAIGPELVGEDGPEHGKLSEVPATAELGQPLTVDVEIRSDAHVDQSTRDGIVHSEGRPAVVPRP